MTVMLKVTGKTVSNKVATEFYNHKLQPIPNHKIIIWDNNFSDIAKQSQIINFLQKINLPKKVCLIVTHEFDFNQINASDIDLILINESDHPTNNYEYLFFTKPYMVLTSDFNKKNYHPFHLLFSCYYAHKDQIDLENKKQYFVSLINRSPRLTRLYLLNKVRQNTKLQNFFIKWSKMSEINGPIPPQEHIKKLLDKDYDDFLRYERNYPHYIPITESRLCTSIEDFLNSYLNIVVESRLEDIGYLTEKVYKPLRAGQLFLVQGPPGTIKYLRSIGFDTFDDFIDHSYDDIQDWQIRTDMMLTELDRIYNQIEEFYIASKDRRQYNRDWLLKDELVQKVLANIGNVK